ncbi:hypothetical protein SGL43_01800 [Streptomyces globisporus]|uniref:Uncharacterized protein n=1 Tax=Streptomyces globisporus TaxID=1908 RepID=A0ABM9GTI4_STRGL|nr:hypothetical protein SGL43_01800 [Streptomyces globisporus]
MLRRCVRGPRSDLCHRGHRVVLAGQGEERAAHRDRVGNDVALGEGQVAPDGRQQIAQKVGEGQEFARQPAGTQQPGDQLVVGAGRDRLTHQGQMRRAGRRGQQGAGRPQPRPLDPQRQLVRHHGAEAVAEQGVGQVQFGLKAVEKGLDQCVEIVRYGLVDPRAAARQLHRHQLQVLGDVRSPGMEGARATARRRKAYQPQARVPDGEPGADPVDCRRAVRCAHAGQPHRRARFRQGRRAATSAGRRVLGALFTPRRPGRVHLLGS